MKKVKINQSHYRPGQALRVPGGWGSQISWQSAHVDGKVVSPIHRPPLPPKKYFWYWFLLRDWVDPRAIVRQDGLCRRKIPMTPSGFEPATFRFVAQCLNRVPHLFCFISVNINNLGARCLEQKLSTWRMLTKSVFFFQSYIYLY